MFIKEWGWCLSETAHWQQQNAYTWACLREKKCRLCRRSCLSIRWKSIFVKSLKSIATAKRMNAAAVIENIMFLRAQVHINRDKNYVKCFKRVRWLALIDCCSANMIDVSDPEACSFHRSKIQNARNIRQYRLWNLHKYLYSINNFNNIEWFALFCWFECCTRGSGVQAKLSICLKNSQSLIITTKKDHASRTNRFSMPKTHKPFS